MNFEYQDSIGNVWWLLFAQLRRHLIRPLNQWEPTDFLAQVANTQWHGNEFLRDNLVTPLYHGEDHRLYYAFVTEIAWCLDHGGKFGETCDALRHVRKQLERYLPLFRGMLNGSCEPFVLQYLPIPALHLLGEEWELAFGLPRERMHQPIDVSFIYNVWSKRSQEQPAGSFAQEGPDGCMADDFLRTILRGLRLSRGWCRRPGTQLSADLFAVACALEKHGNLLAPVCQEFALAWEGSAEELPWLTQSRYRWVRAVARTRLENGTDSMDNAPWTRY